MLPKVLGGRGKSVITVKIRKIAYNHIKTKGNSRTAKCKKSVIKV
uniref:Uncharacterized protein n=1 Tax=Myoviridae sp. ctHFk21 TaxID=2823538 RepID=A0A8S5L5Z8_9CAUD|nr:MAG TPA: hypothetical protein [Myoviridae sp. ctHFk21]